MLVGVKCYGKERVDQSRQNQKGEGWFAILNGVVRVGVLVCMQGFIYHLQKNMCFIP